MARGWRAALLTARLDRDVRKAGPFQLVTDQSHVMVAMGRPGQEARRTTWKHLGERVRDIVRKYVLLDAIPDVEHEAATGFEDSLCLPISAYAVGEKHHSKLAADDIESGIVERQGKRVRLLPPDPGVRTLAFRRMVKHGLIESVTT